MYLYSNMYIPYCHRAEKKKKNHKNKEQKLRHGYFGLNEDSNINYERYHDSRISKNEHWLIVCMYVHLTHCQTIFLMNEKLVGTVSYIVNICLSGGEMFGSIRTN